MNKEYVIFRNGDGQMLDGIPVALGAMARVFAENDEQAYDKWIAAGNVHGDFAIIHVIDVAETQKILPIIR